MESKLQQMRKMRKAFFYEAKDEIAKKNISGIKNVSFFSVILILFFACITTGFASDWELKNQYVFFIPVLLIFFFYSLWYEKSRKHNFFIAQGMTLLFCIVIFGLSISIDVFSYPNLTAAFMPLILLVLPILFIQYSWITYPMITLAEIIYIILIIQVKSSKVHANDIFASLVGLFFSYGVSLMIMRMKTEDIHEKIKFRTMSTTDQLTGLRNKTNCEHSVTEYLHLREKSELCGLMVMDVDDFKNVNDEMGHQAGDDILRAVGGVLLSIFYPDDIIGRIGGDEFMVLMRDVYSSELFDDKCRQIQEKVAKIENAGNKKITMSIGVSILGDEDITFQQLYDLADDALYEAKALGKNQAVVHAPKIKKVKNNKKIMLIADDIEVERAALTAVFEDDFEILQAEDGERTLELLSQYRKQIAILILDIGMPRMNGYDVLRYMKSRTNYNKIPIIVITADSEREKNALLLGADDMVLKPLDPAVLRLRVANVLKRS